MVVCYWRQRLIVGPIYHVRLEIAKLLGVLTLDVVLGNLYGQAVKDESMLGTRDPVSVMAILHRTKECDDVDEWRRSVFAHCRGRHLDGLRVAVRRMMQSNNPVIASYVDFGILQDLAKFGDVNALDTGLRVFHVEGGVKKDDPRWTPLMCAVDVGRNVAVSFLINRRADINWKDQFGNTMLSHAAVNGHSQVLAILLKESSEELIQYKNFRNQTAFDVATEEWQHTCAKLLLRARNKRGDYEVNDAYAPYYPGMVHNAGQSATFGQAGQDMVMDQLISAPTPLWNYKRQQQEDLEWHQHTQQEHQPERDKCKVWLPLACVEASAHPDKW
eukprot:GEMP01052079.1.p1 GENE.GEMP01052079.1~~GEMP01052079.1.p1  ORF type:complete len:330 (+),score=75.16 GEMP01052079.1:87-1076(+)